MAQNHNRSTRQKAYIFVGFQIVAVSVVAVGCGLWRDWAAAYAVLLGGGCYIIPSFCYTYQLFADTRARAVSQIILRFYLGEILKLLTSAVLFLVLVKYVPIQVEMALVGFITAALGFWLVPFFLKLDF